MPAAINNFCIIIIAKTTSTVGNLFGWSTLGITFQTIACKAWNTRKIFLFYNTRRFSLSSWSMSKIPPTIPIEVWRSKNIHPCISSGVTCLRNLCLNAPSFSSLLSLSLSEYISPSLSLPLYVCLSVPLSLSKHI